MNPVNDGPQVTRGGSTRRILSALIIGLVSLTLDMVLSRRRMQRLVQALEEASSGRRNGHERSASGEGFRIRAPPRSLQPNHTHELLAWGVRYAG